MARLLVIDDEAVFREDLAAILRMEGHEVATAGDGRAGIELAGSFEPDLVFCDLSMPGMDGLAVLDEVARRRPDAGVIVVTAFGSLETAVTAFRRGAQDYVLKPVIAEDLIRKIERYLERRRLEKEVRLLRRALSRDAGEGRLIGRSPAMDRLRTQLEKLAPLDSTVLFTGESGAGKDVAARTLHETGRGPDTPYVAVNCAAMPESLFESELFGHVRGAFTGADRDKAGYFEEADGGTLFLDEIAELPQTLQSKLLRVLEDRTFQRVGGTRSITTSARIVCATNRDLAAEVQAGLFRKDLYYRVRVVEVHIPPLRQRREDIPALVEHFVARENLRLKRAVQGVEPVALEALMQHDWPGNVRELANAVERAMILGTGGLLCREDFPRDITGATGSVAVTSDDMRAAVASFERAHIRRVIAAAGGNKEEAARRLGVNPATLYRKLAREDDATD